LRKVSRTEKPLVTVYLPFVVPSAYPCVRLSVKLGDAELIIRAYAVLGCMV